MNHIDEVVSKLKPNPYVNMTGSGVVMEIQPDARSIGENESDSDEMQLIKTSSSGLSAKKHKKVGPIGLRLKKSSSVLLARKLKRKKKLNIFPKRNSGWQAVTDNGDNYVLDEEYKEMNNFSLDSGLIIKKKDNIQVDLANPSDTTTVSVTTSSYEASAHDPPVVNQGHEEASLSTSSWGSQDFSTVSSLSQPEQVEEHMVDTEEYRDEKSVSSNRISVFPNEQPQATYQTIENSFNGDQSVTNQSVASRSVARSTMSRRYMSDQSSYISSTDEDDDSSYGEPDSKGSHFTGNGDSSQTASIFTFENVGERDKKSDMEKEKVDCGTSNDDVKSNVIESLDVFELERDMDVPQDAFSNENSFNEVPKREVYAKDDYVDIGQERSSNMSSGHSQPDQLEKNSDSYGQYDEYPRMENSYPVGDDGQNSYYSHQSQKSKKPGSAHHENNGNHFQNKYNQLDAAGHNSQNVHPEFINYGERDSRSPMSTLSPGSSIHRDKVKDNMYGGVRDMSVRPSYDENEEYEVSEDEEVGVLAEDDVLEEKSQTQNHDVYMNALSIRQGNWKVLPKDVSDSRSVCSVQSAPNRCISKHRPSRSQARYSKRQTSRAPPNNSQNVAALAEKFSKTNMSSQIEDDNDSLKASPWFKDVLEKKQNLAKSKGAGKFNKSLPRKQHEKSPYTQNTSYLNSPHVSNRSPSPVTNQHAPQKKNDFHQRGGGGNDTIDAQHYEQYGNGTDLSRSYSREEYDDDMSQSSKYVDGAHIKQGEASVSSDEYRTTPVSTLLSRRKEAIVAVRPDKNNATCSTPRQQNTYAPESNFPASTQACREYDNFGESSQYNNHYSNCSYREEDYRDYPPEQQNAQQFDYRNVRNSSSVPFHNRTHETHNRPKKAVKVSPCPGLAMRLKKKSYRLEDDHANDRPQDNGTHYIGDGQEDKNHYSGYEDPYYNNNIGSDGQMDFESNEGYINNHGSSYVEYGTHQNDVHVDSQYHDNETYYEEREYSEPLSQNSRYPPYEEDTESENGARNRAFSAFGVALRRVKNDRTSKYSNDSYSNDSYHQNIDNQRSTNVIHGRGMMEEPSNAEYNWSQSTGTGTSDTPKQSDYLVTPRQNTTMNPSYSGGKQMSTRSYLNENSTRGNMVDKAVSTADDEEYNSRNAEIDSRNERTRNNNGFKTSTSPYIPGRKTQSQIKNSPGYQAKNHHTPTPYNKSSMNTSKYDTGSSNIIRSPSPVVNNNNLYRGSSPKPMGSNSSVASHNMSNMRSPSPSGMRYDQREEEQRAYGPRYSRDSPKPLSNGSNPNRNIRSPSPSPLVRKNTARQDNRTDHTYAPSPSRPAAGYSKPSPSVSSSVRSPSPMANRQYSRVQESYGSSENQSNTHSRNIRAPSPSPANHNNANNVYNRQSRDPSHNIETSSAYSSRNVNHTPNKDDYKGYKKNYSSPGLGKRNQSSSRYSAGDSRGPSQYNSAPSVTSTRNFDPEPRDRPESSYPGPMMGQNRMERTHTPSRNGYAPEMRDVEETSFGSKYSKVKELKSSARFGHLNRSYSQGPQNPYYMQENGSNSYVPTVPVHSSNRSQSPFGMNLHQSHQSRGYRYN